VQYPAIDLEVSLDAALTDIVAGRFDSAGSTENTIPMWEAAEAGNDLMITGRWLRKSPFVPVPRRSGTEAHSRLLIGEALAVLERQVKEAAPNRRNRTIIASGDGLTGDSQRCLVRGVGLRRIAK
jgi:hypothetical protein